ncbi:hypothetical protein MLD38_007584 [Melastoma candidum]|uniref:Uncharacterized protein n=1 Tax=Melastoma candidum TaxID=119954 RepID=A0ACB9RRQ7_9MYRT|nr:hypothetical protein MLD38_007584 [Melastoma candidum]
MRPGSVFIQVVPLGTDWAAGTCYVELVNKSWLKYMGYVIHPKESSLYKEHERNNPVLADPNGVMNKWWEYKRNVVLDLRRAQEEAGLSISAVPIPREPDGVVPVPACQQHGERYRASCKIHVTPFPLFCIGFIHTRGF